MDCSAAACAALEDSEVEFVGRNYYLQELNKAFSRYKLFGIFGLRSVGKSRLVKEFIRRSCDNKDPNGSTVGKESSLKCITVDLHLHVDISSLYTFICSSLGVVPKHNGINSNKWKVQIEREISKRNNQTFVVILDNAEDVLENEKIKNELTSFILMLAKQCNNVKIFITSTTKILFAQYGKLLFKIEVLQMPQMEATLLLRKAAINVDFGEEEEKIVKLSEGLPLLLQMIGAEMRHGDQSITPKEMVELLAKFRLEALSRDFYPADQRAADVYRKFIERLSDIHQSRLAILGFIPGSFNTLEAKELLEQETDAITKEYSLIPIRRKHMLNYDSSSERFDIQGILRECLQVFFTIRDLPEVRSRYYKVFSRVMQEICKKLGTVQYTMALAEFSIEQPNLVKLLTEVFHSKEDNYHFFIEIATTCTSMIENFMSNVSDRFYQGCLNAAEMYGRDLDKATVHIAIGSLTTNSKGKFPLGEENYRSALRILEPHGKSIQLATVYQRLGWNLHSQGKSFESLRYFQKALSISQTSGKEYENVMLQALSSKGIVHNWLGSFTDAEKCHFEVLRRRKRSLGECHPVVGETMNNIGLLYDQMGDQQKALQYFEEGLDIKRRNKGTIWSISFSLNNVANKYTLLKRFDAAKHYLDESMAILNEMENPHRNAISLTFNSYGKMYRAMGDYEMALEMFAKAIQIRREIMPNSIAYIWSVIQYAQVMIEMNKHSAAMHQINDILRDKDKPMTDMPHNDFVLECLQIKAAIYRSTGQMDKYNKTLWKIQSELIRLGDEFQRRCNEAKVEQITKKLTELRFQIAT